jgi:hypothetical protein
MKSTMSPQDMKVYRSLLQERQQLLQKQKLLMQKQNQIRVAGGIQKPKIVQKQQPMQSKPTPMPMLQQQQQQPTMVPAAAPEPHIPIHPNRLAGSRKPIFIHQSAFEAMQKRHDALQSQPLPGFAGVQLKTAGAGKGKKMMSENGAGHFDAAAAGRAGDFGLHEGRVQVPYSHPEDLRFGGAQRKPSLGAASLGAALIDVDSSSTGGCMEYGGDAKKKSKKKAGTEMEREEAQALAEASESDGAADDGSPPESENMGGGKKKKKKSKAKSKSKSKKSKSKKHGKKKKRGLINEL